MSTTLTDAELSHLIVACATSSLRDGDRGSRWRFAFDELTHKLTAMRDELVEAAGTPVERIENPNERNEREAEENYR